MRQIAAARSSAHALDQWGIEFPLPLEEAHDLPRPASSSLARAISSWRLSIASWRVSIATAWLAHDGAFDQWGIEFPITEGESAALARRLRRACLQARSSVLGVHLREISRAGALAAILAVVVSSSALAVDQSASAGSAPLATAPTGGQPVVIAEAGSAQIASLPSTAGPLSTIAPPSTVSNPTFGPTPSATSAAEEIAIKPASSTPTPGVPEARASKAASIAIPTVQDARNYLVARLGVKVVRRWGTSQSQCASVIFEYESRWDPHAINKSSGAYGIPQVKPVSKLANWAEAKARVAANAGDAKAAWLYRAWRDNPVVQAEWGVDYMIDRYGSPCDALAFEDETGWY